jgi:hypothetical protein
MHAVASGGLLSVVNNVVGRAEETARASERALVRHGCVKVSDHGTTRRKEVTRLGSLTGSNRNGPSRRLA